MKIALTSALLLASVFSANASNYSSAGEALFWGFLQGVFMLVVAFVYNIIKEILKK